MVIQVLETVTKEEERKREKLGCVQQNSSLAWRTELSGGAPDSVWWCTRQCPVRQAGPHELAALVIRRWRTTIIHRTVR
jgi:hypothetical protein